VKAVSQSVAEMLVKRQHEHGDMKSLKGHARHADDWSLLATGKERKN
jgi:hypothetical protein